MERVGLGRQALLLFALGCFGCDHAADPARGSEQGVRSGDGEPMLISRDAGGTLTTRPVERDGGGLASVTKPKDAGVPGVVEAGQAAGPSIPAPPVAGPLLDRDGGSIEPNPTPGHPHCQTRFYRDLDGDGFGDPRAAVLSCTQPLGFVLVAGDCYDQNERARPGASGQFLTHRGDGSFDYDCDGIETLARTKFALCPSLVGACPPNALGCDDAALRASWDAAEEGGWTDFRSVPCLGELCPSDKSKVPACGQAGSWGLSVSWDLLGAKYGCTVPTAGTTRIQTCR